MSEAAMPPTIEELREHPLVSVVVTTYKRDVRYLKEALESILVQTYPNLEVIVVDDNGVGSAYSAPIEELCGAYDYVRYLPNRTNIGAQRSRNVGIESSSGEYIAFLDDDDIWMSEKIETQMEYFSDSSVGMVYCDGYSFNDGDMESLGVFREASIFNIPISYKLELFNDYVGSTSQAVVKRECFERVGLFDPDMPARQDYEMWLRISRSFKIVGSPEKLLYYRKHEGERISTNWDKCRRSYLLILNKHFNGYKNCKYACSKLMLRVFDCSLNMHQFGFALRYLVKAFFASPACVFDVVRRHITGKAFSEVYTISKLNTVLGLER